MKFSKSSGNGTAIQQYVSKYGVDVLNLWVATQEENTDVVFSESKLEEMKKLYARLRLTLRFMTSNLYDYANHAPEYNHPAFDVHRYVLVEMTKLRQKMIEHTTGYEFKNAVTDLYEFCDKVLSNWYFDWLRNPLYLLKKDNPERKMYQSGMFEVMNGMFDLIKVVCPVVAEEFYKDYYGSDTSVMMHNYFSEQKIAQISQFETVDWGYIQAVRKNILSGIDSLQQTKTIRSRTEVGVALGVNDVGLFDYLNKNYSLTDIFNVSFVDYFVGDGMTFTVLSNNPEYKKCPRCWNYHPTFDDELCDFCTENN